jgi:hypothetical protein
MDGVQENVCIGDEIEIFAIIQAGKPPNSLVITGKAFLESPLESFLPQGIVGFNQHNLSPGVVFQNPFKQGIHFWMQLKQTLRADIVMTITPQPQGFPFHVDSLESGRDEGGRDIAETDAGFSVVGLKIFGFNQGGGKKIVHLRNATGNGGTQGGALDRGQVEKGEKVVHGVAAGFKIKQHVKLLGADSGNGMREAIGDMAILGFGEDGLWLREQGFEQVLNNPDTVFGADKGQRKFFLTEPLE